MTTITESIYQLVLSKLVSGEIAPGSVIQERKLAEELNVSRTPLRSALSQLYGEGMLERLSNGVLVSCSITQTDLLELLHVRWLLEGEAAANAAGRIPTHELLGLAKTLETRLAHPPAEEDWSADDKVHELIAQYCGNKVLQKMLHTIKRQSILCRVEEIPERRMIGRHEHLKIAQALLLADGALAKEAVQEHIHNVRRAYIDSLIHQL